MLIWWLAHEKFRVHIWAVVSKSLARKNWQECFFQSSNFQLLDLTGRDICCWSFSFNGLFYPSWSHPWFKSEPTKTLIFVWLQTRVSKHLKLDKRWSLVGWSLSVFWSVQTYRPKPPWPNSAPMKPPPRPPMAAPGVPRGIIWGVINWVYCISWPAGF